jgi:hypothetical protein
MAHRGRNERQSLSFCQNVWKRSSVVKTYSQLLSIVQYWHWSQVHYWKYWREIKHANSISFIKFRVFWIVAPCSHVEVDRRFRGAYCLHHTDDRGSTYLRNVCHRATFQKTLNFILAAVEHELSKSLFIICRLCSSSLWRQCCTWLLKLQRNFPCLSGLEMGEYVAEKIW